MRFHHLAKKCTHGTSRLKLSTLKKKRKKFDWLPVCNGHYSVPRYPSIPGLSTCVASGKVSHSVSYSNPSLRPLPSSAKVLVIDGGPSGQDIAAGLLSSLLINQVIHSTSRPSTIADVNPRLIARPRLSKFFTDSSTVQFCDSSIESSISEYPRKCLKEYWNMIYSMLRY